MKATPTGKASSKTTTPRTSSSESKSNPSSTSTETQKKVTHKNSKIPLQIFPLNFDQLPNPHLELRGGMNLLVNFTKVKGIDSKKQWVPAEPTPRLANKPETMEIKCSFTERYRHREKNPLISHKDLTRSYGYCEFDTIFGALELPKGDYGLDLKFLTSENYAIENFVGFVIKVDSLNPKYIFYSMILRYCMIFLSMFFLGRYWMKMVQIPKKFWSFEQKYLRSLGIGIILYNDPLALMNVTYPTKISYCLKFKGLGLWFMLCFNKFTTS
jgi:hypothetical protein